MLSSLRDLALAADSAGVGLGAFNVIHLEHATAFVRAAELTGRPVVLQISENAVRYHGALAPLCLATLAVARESSAQVAVHLDHAEDVDLIAEAVALGVSSVMYDGSRLPDAENRAATREVVALCHASGVDVEAELGEVGGKNGVHDPSARTSPQDAARFVAETGVVMTTNSVMRSSWTAGRPAMADDTSMDATSTQPVPSVVPMVGGCMRA